MMEWFRQLGRAIRNLARIARAQPIWAITALVVSPVALIRHLFGVLVLFLITALMLGIGVPLILGKLLGLPRDSNIYQKIGRASCRERVCQYVYISVVAVSLNKKKRYIIK